MTPERIEQWQQIQSFIQKALNELRVIRSEEGQGDKVNTHRVYTSLDSAINNIPRPPK